MFTRAIVRTPGTNFASGITTSEFGRPDHRSMLHQHREYVTALKALGLDVLVLESLAGYPDSHFIEDVAVITPDLAVITRPGAAARLGEEQSVSPVVARFRKTEFILAPGTVDGGDVLMIGRHFFIGVSERTNREGAEQLGSILERYGNTWSAVPIEDGLHLKSSVNNVADNTLLLTEALARQAVFGRYGHIVLNEKDAYACNSLLINATILTPSGFPQVSARLRATGLDVIELDMSEAQKMDGGLTCLSLRF